MADVGPVLIAGAVTAFGWYATYAYAKLREDRTRRLDLLLKLRARQIEELYGPLLSLIEQIFNVWQVRENVLRGTAYSKKEPAANPRVFLAKVLYPAPPRDRGAITY